jgi:hypothetical protein
VGNRRSNQYVWDIRLSKQFQSEYRNLEYQGCKFHAEHPTVTGRRLGAVGLEYGMSAVLARENLITAKSWTIIGDASGCPDPGNFVTIWDLNLDPGSGTDQIQFNDAMVLGGGVYTWQELPSGATGNGTLASGDFLRTISKLPASTIRLNIASD